MGAGGPVNCGKYYSSVSISKNDLDLLVTEGETLTLEFKDYFRYYYLSYQNYQLTIETTHIEKTATVSWQEVCQNV